MSPGRTNTKGFYLGYKSTFGDLFLPCQLSKADPKISTFVTSKQNTLPFTYVCETGSRKTNLFKNTLLLHVQQLPFLDAHMNIHKVALEFASAKVKCAFFWMLQKKKFKSQTLLPTFLYLFTFALHFSDTFSNFTTS